MMKTRTIVIGGVIGAIVLSFFLFFMPSADIREMPMPMPRPQMMPGPQIMPRPQMMPGPQPAPLPEDRLSAVDRILEQLKFGNIVFNAPKTMNFRDTAVIQLVLGLKAPIDELKRMIEATGEKEGAHIRVSDRMEARLSGPNFAITAITPEIQAVSQSDITEWKWEVKPSSDGRHYLHLTLSAILSVEGASTPRVIRTFDKVIEVEVAWHQRVGYLLEKNWQWMWAAILVPVAGWLWKKNKKSKSEVSETDS